MNGAQAVVGSPYFPALTNNTGISAESRGCDWERFESPVSVTLDSPHMDSLQGFLDALTESTEDDWDGYGAKGIDAPTCLNALAFLLLLPSTLPTPEISAQPNGAIAFEWLRERRQMFSVSIGRTNRMAYAGLFGNSTVYGAEYFVDQIPQVVFQNIERLNEQL